MDLVAYDGSSREQVPVGLQILKAPNTPKQILKAPKILGVWDLWFTAIRNRLNRIE